MSAISPREVKNCEICGFPEREPHNHLTPTPTPLPFPTDPRLQHLEDTGHVYGQKRIVEKKERNCSVCKIANSFFKGIGNFLWAIITFPFSCCVKKKKQEKEAGEKRCR